MDDKLIVKENYLNQIQLNLNIIEYKFILTCISMINKDDEDFLRIKIKVKEFSNLIGLNNDGVYKELQKAVYTLGTKALGIIEAETGDYVVRSWFEEIRYIRDKGIVECIFNNRLKPFLLYVLINKGYTKYLLKNIIYMKSKYSIKIFELLKQYENKSVVTIEINKLKNILGIENKYKKYAQIKLRILEPASKELLNHTDIYFTYSEIKKGRSVSAIRFTIHKNDRDIKDIQFKKFNKKQIINLIIEKIFNDYRITFDTNTLSKYHRIYLIEFYKSLHNLIPKDIVSPKAFLTWKLNDIYEMYDNEQLSKKFEDY